MTNYRGILAAVCAYILWGVLPIYWKLLEGIPAYEILCHRMSWSLIVTVGLVFLLKRQNNLKRAIGDRKNILIFTATALLLTVNWLLYIWAVNAGYIIETSLGYFINPLINVFFGMIFFQERMRPLQWVALALAFIGVLYLTIFYGRFPWIALILAISFATYGLLHKKTSLAALDGLCLETGVLFLPAAALLVGLYVSGEGAFGHTGPADSLLLIGSGLITTIPLLFFGYAAQNMPLSTLGLLQYLAPTINLLIGIYVYNEDFPPERMTGFIIVWGGLGLYLLEKFFRHFSREKKVLEKSFSALLLKSNHKKQETK